MPESVEPFPFATVPELRQRWPGLPEADEARAGVLLEDASQFILDVAPSAASVHERTRRRVVCSVVKRAMEAETLGMGGLKTIQATDGPFSDSMTAANPDGDFYLTKQEKFALGVGRQVAFTVPLISEAQS